jgi:hypothetical protein
VNTLKIPFKSGITVVAFFCAFWFGLAASSGALFSGFHIADDHEIVSIHDEFSSHVPFGTVLKREIKSDLEIRFRPLYYFDRIMTIRALGDNFILWSLYRSLLACCTMFLLFCAARRLGLGVLEAILFPALTLVGIQSNVWFWRGPAEAEATLMLAVSLYCVCRRATAGKLFFDALLVVSCAAMSLIKENYSLAIPSLCLLKASLDRRQSGGSWKESIRPDWPLYMALLGILAIDLLIIKVFVGTNQTGYAGVQINLIKYIAVSLQFLFYNGQGIVLCLLLLGFGFFYAGKKEVILVYSLVFVVFLAPQIAVYAKSGLLAGQGRYLLPASAGFSLAICALIHGFNKDMPEVSARANMIIKTVLVLLVLSCTVFCAAVLLSGTFSSAILSVIARIKGHSAAGHWLTRLNHFAALFLFSGCLSCAGILALWKIKRLRSLALLAVFVMLSYCCMSAFNAGRGFYREGRDFKLCMDEINNHTDAASPIVVVADPGFNVEGVHSVTRYLSIKMNRRNLRYWFFDSKISNEAYLQDWKNITLCLYGNRKIDRLPELSAAACLLILNDMEKPFLESGGSGITVDFTEEKFGALACYVRK